MPSSPRACAGLLGSALWQKACGRRIRQPEKSATLVAAGLSREVWICRDDAGIPQVYGETSGDLAFGLGLAMTQDRLWQMETLRRLASGRLAELTGDRPLDGTNLHLPGATILEVDSLYRSLRMQAVGHEERSLLSDRGRSVTEGFAAGANAWIGQCRPRDLPPEFLLTGVRPEPWTPEDTLAVGKVVAWFLSLVFAAKPILATLGRDSALHPLLPPNVSRGGCILGDGVPSAWSSVDHLARWALGLAGPGMGSNSWVVSGDRSASGKPLLCNDPHLVFGLPALWYPAALHGPDYRVIGATMPGIPAILIGRNDHLAWGFTAVMADDGDFYRETLDTEGAHYLRDGIWHPVEVVEEEFRIRGRASVRRKLRYVRHGAVLCPLLPQSTGGHPTSFRWVGLEPWKGLEAFLGMNRAKGVGEFEAALQDFGPPAQNTVVADRQGTIAYFCAGKFPRRSQETGFSAILDGASPQDAWQGYLTWPEQPKSINPPRGFVVTANNRIAPELSPSLATGFWEPAYRATRIAELLEGSYKVDVDSMVHIQVDVLSLQAVGILAHLVRPIASVLEDSRAQRAAALLLDWDGRMLADSAPAALYHFFYQELLQRCFRPIMERLAPGAFAQYFSTLHLAVPAVDAALLTSDGLWFPDGARAMVETCLRAAWEAAVTKCGPDPSAWRWGALHTLTFSHSFGRGRGVLARVLAWLLDLNRGPYPRPGDGMSVNLGAYALSRPFEVVVGPSYRQIVDLGNPEASRWILAGGVSGDPHSPHYADQIELWLRGEYRPMRFLPVTDREHRNAVHLVPDTAVRVQRHDTAKG